MKDIVFVTGNVAKAEYLSKYLGYSVDHMKLDLDEVQSLDLKEVVKHKVRQAYAQVNRPVLVEDAGLFFDELGGLPGPLIKWFIEALSFEKICSLLDGKNRNASAKCVFGYFDGQNEAYFEGGMRGKISETPSGEGGFGFDLIFIPEGYSVTRADLSEEDDRKTYLQIKPLEKVKLFLEGLK